MPIASYLAFPAQGRFDELRRALEAVPACEVLPADGGELLVVVTDTGDADEERALQRRLGELEPLASLALVYARTDDHEPATPQSERRPGSPPSR